MSPVCAHIRENSRVYDDTLTAGNVGSQRIHEKCDIRDTCAFRVSDLFYTHVSNVTFMTQKMELRRYQREHFVCRIPEHVVNRGIQRMGHGPDRDLACNINDPHSRMEPLTGDTGGRQRSKTERKSMEKLPCKTGYGTGIDPAAGFFSKNNID